MPSENPTTPKFRPFVDCTEEVRFIVMDGGPSRKAFSCCDAHVAQALEECDIRGMNYAEVDRAGAYGDDWEVDKCGTVEVMP